MDINIYSAGSTIGPQSAVAIEIGRVVAEILKSTFVLNARRSNGTIFLGQISWFLLPLSRNARVTKRPHRVLVQFKPIPVRNRWFNQVINLDYQLTAIEFAKEVLCELPLSDAEKESLLLGYYSLIGYKPKKRRMNC